MFTHGSVSGGLFSNAQNKGFGFSSGLGTGAGTATSGFGTGLGAAGLGGFGGFSIQSAQQQQGESSLFPYESPVIYMQNINNDFWVSMRKSLLPVPGHSCMKHKHHIANYEMGT